MDIWTPPQAVAAVAAFVRDRLVEVTGTIAPRGHRRDGEVLPAIGQDRSGVTGARQVAMVIVGAAAPFAPTSYARARLIRQLHASGLLSSEELCHTTTVIEAEFVQTPDGCGAPR